MLTGTFSALYTPMSPDGSVDASALRALCERQVAAGVGLVPCGTTGETPTLTPEEYDLVVSTAVEVAAGRVPVIAGTGSNNTRSAIAQTRHARELGVDYALVVVPYYNKPPQPSLLAHFRAVADEGGLPVILYNVPGRTGGGMAAETTLALAQHPQVVAVKEASADMDQIQHLCFGAPEGFSILSGDDAWTLPMILLGAHGVVSVAGNVAPAPMRAMVDAALAGRLEEARRYQAQLLPLFSALFATTNPIPLKRAAAILGHAGATTRLPLTSDACTPPMVAALEAALERALGGT